MIVFRAISILEFDKRRGLKETERGYEEGCRREEEKVMKMHREADIGGRKIDLKNINFEIRKKGKMQEKSVTGT